MNRQAAIALVRALSRAMKAVGYYDSGHPILQQLHREVIGQLKGACQGHQGLVLACAGAKLLFAENEEPLADESAKALAASLFSRSIVALKILPTAGGRELGLLFQALSEAPERLREAGGLQPILIRSGLNGVEAFEVDFASLFAGKKTDIGAKDPLVQRALAELLQFKEKKDKAGSALAISLDHISTPESLGTLLDELLEKAGAGVAAPSVGPTQSAGKIKTAAGAPARLTGEKQTGSARGTKELGPLRGVRRGGEYGSEALAGVSPEELAELASQAFLGTYEKLMSQAAPEERLTQTAQVLASALVRLNPQARFALLQQLAKNPKGNGAGAGAGTQGLTCLSTQVKDDLLVGAIASALAGQQGDPETINAVANLVRHLRPIESERRKLLETLDETLRGEGHAIDGTVWQELQANALGSNGLGMLEIPFRQKMKPLAEQAQAHLKSSHDPEVKQVVSALEPRHRLNRSAKLLLELIPNNREVNQGEAAMLKDTIEALESTEATPSEDHLRLLAFLLKRAEGQRAASAVMQVVKELLSGIKGTPRAVALLKSGFCAGSAILADALLQALDGPLTIDGKRELVAAFAGMDEAMVRSVRPKVVDAKPMGVFQIVSGALRSNANSGVELARQALRNRAIKSKESVLRAVGTISEPGGIALLAKAAGVESDEESIKALCLDEKQVMESDANLRQLQRAAIEALGQTRSQLSVPPLENLLMRRKLVGNTAFDSLRPYIAQALATNGTPRARQVLAEGKVNKYQNIRDACMKVG